VKQWLMIGVFAAAGYLLISADKAAGQVFLQNQPNPYLRPPVSPYLNLNRPGVPGGVNYYGLVKPQFEVNKQLQNLQMQQRGMMPQLGVGEEDVTTSAYAITGHPTAFFYYSHYFGQAGGNVRPAQPPPAVLKKQ
jgi:hypothetical protein